MAKTVGIIGGSVAATQTALTLAELGAEVSIFTPSMALGQDNSDAWAACQEDLLRLWPLLARAASHPRISLYTNTLVESVEGDPGKLQIKATRRPRYVRQELCTGCGRCVETCSVIVRSNVGDQRVTHSAIHGPLLGAKTVPSAYTIDKNGTAPCRAACPLGINVPGFVSLLAKGKADKALSLISAAAPLAAVLGRVCTHPCESDCTRGQIDKPVFIQALHRYAADNAVAGIRYDYKARPGSRKERVAIVGSGPAGLAAAWELARCGYRPTIFESRAVIGGMLATGIPRYRLPREVREREVEAIKALGVDIKTGITLGRDMTFSDLRDRGYQAFFLAIGAQQDNNLNIPGEDLDGVVGSLSLLLALNLKVGASVGSDMVVIGGGNSAVDAARTAKRRRKGTVRILYRRTAEEMTAIKEDIEEAIKEGIAIDYLTAPVEILGDGTRVTGIRCQRMALGAMESDGRRRAEPVPGSEFVINADHVAVAIGQRPDSSVLNMRGLRVDADQDTIGVDRLTLETNMPGVFAGGDCVSGPNNVVEAVAAGIRAADSVDRYLRGHDLREGRSLEKPPLAEVNVREMEASPDRRARMPLITHSKRMASFEETRKGLPPGTAQREAGRCLNCATCSECLECEQSCELGAILHGDASEQLDMSADLVIDFSAGKSDARRLSAPGIHTVPGGGDGDPWIELARASAEGLEAALRLGLREREELPAVPGQADVLRRRRPSVPLETGIAVILCRCGGSINSVVDFKQMTNELLATGRVSHVHEMSQVCTEAGAAGVKRQVAEWKAGRVVVAACRCCNLEQICFSCTDRRVMCQQYLGHALDIPRSVGVEFVNIREQCAWIHADDPRGATRRAVELTRSAVARAGGALPAAIEERPVESGALVLGAGPGALAAATGLAAQGYSVTMVSGPEAAESGKRRPAEGARARLPDGLKGQRVRVRAWPDVLEIGGSPGSYEAAVRGRSQTSRVRAGAMVLDISALAGKLPDVFTTVLRDGFLGRIIARACSSSPAVPNVAILRELSIKETAGVFIIPPGGDLSPEDQVIRGKAVAARASAYLSQGTVRPRASVVTIDAGLCRGCGDCTAACPYMELRQSADGLARAYVDPALCLGCGACIARCPTGAITQPIQSDSQISSLLETVLLKAANTGENR
ncbi:MAG: FAD-dependent oxidoreductase [Chloroflexota bacterium]